MKAVVFAFAWCFLTLSLLIDQVTVAGRVTFDDHVIDIALDADPANDRCADKWLQPEDTKIICVNRIKIIGNNLGIIIIIILVQNFFHELFATWVMDTQYFRFMLSPAQAL